MGRSWRYVLFFLLCLAIALVLHLPVQHPLHQVKIPDTVRVAGIDGTFFSGQAAQITLDRFPLNAVQYRFLPSCLLSLKVCYRIVYDRGELRVGYDLINGDAEISETRLDYPISDLMAYMPNPLIRPTGRLELSVEQMSVIQGKPASMNGRLLWRNLGVDDQDIRIDIGDLQLDFSGDLNGYEFTVSDVDASVDVTGDGSVRADGVYEVDIRISSETGIDPQVKQVLGVVAKSTGFNQYRIQQSGRLPPNLTRQLF